MYTIRSNNRYNLQKYKIHKKYIQLIILILILTYVYKKNQRINRFLE